MKPSAASALARALALALALAAVGTGCTDAEPAVVDPYPDPGAHEPMAGPGAGHVAVAADKLGAVCAWVSGGPDDKTQHHNLVVPFEGYLFMPWAPETAAQGGVSLFDMSDPCQPERIGYATTKQMRETHSVGFSFEGGRWAVVNHGEGIIYGGILFWDLADLANPQVASVLKFDDFLYPDAYEKVTLSVFWQGDTVYVGGGNPGVYIVDASDPTQPKLVNQYTFDPPLRVGQVQAIGDLLVVGSADDARAALLDISDPRNPKPIAGGDFTVRDSTGKPRKYYFNNVRDGLFWATRKDGGGGLMIWDIRDPSAPKFRSEVVTDGKGGYVFFHEDRAFCGESDHAVGFDISNLDAIEEIGRWKMTGDLDTATPVGNLLLLSVDDKADKDNAAGSGVVPLRAAPDTTPPRVTWVWPPDGSKTLRPTSRVGITLTEMVEPKTAWQGSVRLYREDLGPERGTVESIVQAQEHIVNVTPRAPLAPGRYVLQVRAGGLRDWAGNALQEPFEAHYEVLP